MSDAQLRCGSDRVCQLTEIQTHWAPTSSYSRDEIERPTASRRQASATPRRGTVVAIARKEQTRATEQVTYVVHWRFDVVTVGDAHCVIPPPSLVQLSRRNTDQPRSPLRFHRLTKETKENSVPVATVDGISSRYWNKRLTVADVRTFLVMFLLYSSLSHILSSKVTLPSRILNLYCKHWRLFVSVSSFLYLFFSGYACWIKLNTFSF